MDRRNQIEPKMAEPPRTEKMTIPLFLCMAAIEMRHIANAAGHYPLEAPVFPLWASLKNTFGHKARRATDNASA